MQLRSIGLVLALNWFFPVAATAAPEEALPSPTSVVLPSPLRTRVLWAGGYSELTRPHRGAWISSDGKSVAFLTRESRESEAPARALIVKDVDTNTIRFQQLLYSEEESGQYSGPELERLGRSRAWEALPTLEQREWKPLPYQENPRSESEFVSDGCYSVQLRPKRSVSLDGVNITYQEPRVQIWNRGKKVLDRRFASWRVRKKHCDGANPSWLQGAFISREHGVVLLELDFCGADSCGEPPAAFHVLRIPKDKVRPGGTSPAQDRVPFQVPSVRYEQAPYVSQHLYAAGFPAISEDGTLVALAESFTDGERKDPNILLTIRRPQTQEIVWRFPVLEAGEVSAATGTLAKVEELDKKVMERIRQTNTYLSQTKWVPLKEQPIQPMVTESCQQAPSQTLKLPGLELTFNQGRLLKQDGSSTPIDLKLTREGSTTEAACTASSRTFLDAAYVDQPRGIVLLRLTTCKDENCPEQDGWYHALSLH